MIMILHMYFKLTIVEGIVVMIFVPMMTLTVPYQHCSLWLLCPVFLINGEPL